MKNFIEKVLQIVYLDVDSFSKKKIKYSFLSI